MAAALLAKDLGVTVLSTTRRPERAGRLEELGIDRIVVDDGHIAPAVNDIVPGGVHAALELVGTNTLPDTLWSTRVHGVVCFTGMLSNQWTVPDFYPIEYIPQGVRLTAYGGEADNLPVATLQAFLDDVAAGRLAIPIHKAYRLDETSDAHRDMEEGIAIGKQVVVLD